MRGMQTTLTQGLPSHRLPTDGCRRIAITGNHDSPALPVLSLKDTLIRGIGAASKPAWDRDIGTAMVQPPKGERCTTQPARGEPRSHDVALAPRMEIHDMHCRRNISPVWQRLGTARGACFRPAERLDPRSRACGRWNPGFVQRHCRACKSRGRVYISPSAARQKYGVIEVSSARLRRLDLPRNEHSDS